MTKTLKLLYLLFFLGLSACTINNEDIESAQQACKNNGGLQSVYVDIGETQYFCQNGASFNQKTLKNQNKDK